MKNLSLILNIVLLIAVGVLFFLHFSKDKPAGGTESSSLEPGELSVAYIDSDTVLKYYEYLKVEKATLEEKTTKMDQDFRNRAQGLKNEIEAYQRNVSSMTLGQVRATEEELGKKQQNLQMYQQSLSQALMEEEAKLNRELYTRVTEYLKKYGKEKGLHVVLKHDPASDVLWANDALDISQDVITGLNSEYTAEKGGVAPKKDSTVTK